MTLLLLLKFNSKFQVNSRFQLHYILIFELFILIQNDLSLKLFVFPGKNVHLIFKTFELEDEQQDCGYDFIEVFSGFDDTGPMHGRF